MRDILLREGAITRRKKRFWVVGLRFDRRIMCIELVGLGSSTRAAINPIEIYHLTVL
uniref:Uncharacterized protein n=1 Tax=Candidatus Kentrum eta TaxID=2126337 RepID=A0A450VUZ2_9GAMM|nr:MAG: hypothetical protein BECKH772B_GA0070898_108552 [Candidatus Kentron sp. H]VFK08516.1 MAG: hypothetical protein BECKH772A_GA0070896_108671 [Candidatus Kentron sp. H]VFK11552.1 MAG: hypothetical protein BECKH772C_GA0070978_108331 [Candidatus Kentron sp. H]